MNSNIGRGTKNGTAMLAVLVICAILCTSVAGYLTVVSQQNYLSVRSQAWNMAIAVAEAGVEEGLEHLNANYPSTLATQGWQANGAIYTYTNSVGGNIYMVTIDASTSKPKVRAKAIVNTPRLAQARPNYFLGAIGVGGSGGSATVSRAIEVTCYRARPFAFALVAKDKVKANGNNVWAQSFNSSVIGMHTDNRYDASQYEGSKANVASNSGEPISVDVGNANIYGRVSTGPGGTVHVGNNGGVGSHEWQASNNGVQGEGTADSWVTDDANFTFPETKLPDTNGWFTSFSPSFSITTNYLNSGSYVLSNGQMKQRPIVVLGAVTVVVPDGLDLTGSDDAIIMASGGSMTLYVSGDVKISGQAVMNPKPGKAQDFIIYCAPDVTSFEFKLSGNGEFAGVVVAPSAEIKLSGGGNNRLDFTGAIIANSITLNGHINVYYDEALDDYSPNSRFLIETWNEVNL
jgi:hypothetical protein